MLTSEDIRRQIEAMSDESVAVFNEAFWAAVVQRVESLPADQRGQAQDHLYALWDLLRADDDEDTGEDDAA